MNANAASDEQSTVKAKLNQLDDYQQSHKALAIPVAVIRKFGEDKSTNLASMIAFWAFFSIFPLFMVLVTLLGFLLPGDTKGQVLTRVSQMFPLLDTSQVSGLTGATPTPQLPMMTVVTPCHGEHVTIGSHAICAS